MINYNSTILRFHSFCVTLSSIDVCNIHRILSLLIQRRVRDHIMWSLLFLCTYLDTCRVRIVLSVIFIPGFVMFMD